MVNPPGSRKFTPGQQYGHRDGPENSKWKNLSRTLKAFNTLNQYHLVAGISRGIVVINDVIIIDDFMMPLL
jgi:hypothetical protein